jgi:hypothetical protein
MVPWTMATVPVHESTMDSGHGTAGARRTWVVRPLRSMGACCNEGKRESGATRFSPRALATREEAELSRQRWTMVAAVLTRRQSEGEMER